MKALREVALGFALLAIPATVVIADDGNTISGSTRVVDGDTLVVAGKRVRLYGIDAPESAQMCGTMACGQAATAYLANVLLPYGRAVVCEGKMTDRYGRTVATCSVSVFDLGAMMVQAGWAMEYTRYSDGRYHEFEAEARAARRGMWATDFKPPWQWRQEHAR